jgi:hypothetical protein
MVVSAENTVLVKQSRDRPSFALVGITVSTFADKEWYLPKSIACFMKVSFKKFPTSWRAYKIVITRI